VSSTSWRGFSLAFTMATPIAINPASSRTLIKMAGQNNSRTPDFGFYTA
jgi:hypothetical protein